MGYRETNWSLPRKQQEIIERQNIYDGTWFKTPSMGWMFVPLMQYHGGGKAATYEPLHEHIDDYEHRLANLFTSGVQAAWRGKELYDTEETKTVVKKWVNFYKKTAVLLPDWGYLFLFPAWPVGGGYWCAILALLEPRLGGRGKGMAGGGSHSGFGRRVSDLTTRAGVKRVKFFCPLNTGALEGV